MYGMAIAQLVALLIPVILIIVGVGAVTVLLPLMRRLGEYLDLRMEERRTLGRGSPDALDRVLTSLEVIEGRLKGLEERQDFMEKLLEKPRGERRDGELS